MENNVLLPDTLSFLEEIVVEAGLPKSVTERPEFLSSLVLGTENDDSLSGTANRDYIFGLEGNDELDGLGGNDFLFGGSGDNTIRGGEGRDRIYSGAGKDELFGDAGDDRFRDVSGGNTIDGGEGRDTVNYRNIDDPIFFRFDVLTNFDGPVTTEGRLEVARFDLEPDIVSSIERVIAPEGQPNTIEFSENGPQRGAPLLLAPAIDVDLSQNRLNFDDTSVNIENFQNVSGSTSSDTIVGNDGDNELDGLIGADVIEGKGGDDFLKTYEEDLLIGGGGRDAFELTGYIKFDPRDGFDSLDPSTIADFESGVDKIQLSREGDSFNIDGRSLIFENFSALPEGQLSEDRFQVLGSGDPVSSEARLAYDGMTGDLLYTGLNTAAANTKIATLQGAPDISASDIFVV